MLQTELIEKKRIRRVKQDGLKIDTLLIEKDTRDVSLIGIQITSIIIWFFPHQVGIATLSSINKHGNVGYELIRRGYY